MGAMAGLHVRSPLFLRWWGDTVDMLLTTSDSLQAPALPGDVGYDLHASERVYIAAGGFAAVPTAVHVQLPAGYFGLILPRSSANATGALVALTGVIDNGYRGELLVMVHNIGRVPDGHVGGRWIEAGQALAQLVLFPISVFPLQRVTELEPSERGHNRMGSTGRSV